MERTRAPVAARVAVMAVVAAALLAGIWVTGGLISDDFAVSMVLTGGWVAVSAAACLVVALRSRTLRWPVLAGYAVAAAAAAAYLGPAVIGDRVVSERVAVPDQGNVQVHTARFEPVRHDARGTAALIRLAGGGRVLTLTDFAVANGPDLRLYLVAGPARTESDVHDRIDLGALKGNVGDQQYRIPRGVDVERYATVVVWCRAFSVLFARAPLA